MAETWRGNILELIQDVKRSGTANNADTAEASTGGALGVKEDESRT